MLTRPTRKAPVRGSPERAALGKQDRCGYLPETLWDPVRLFPPENRWVRVSIWTTWVPPPPPPFRPHHYHLPAQDSKHLLWEANASFPLHSWERVLLSTERLESRASHFHFPQGHVFSNQIWKEGSWYFQAACGPA